MIDISRAKRPVNATISISQTYIACPWANESDCHLRHSVMTHDTIAKSTALLNISLFRTLNRKVPYPIGLKGCV